MGRGKSDKITYKPYTQAQPYFIPPTADELIPHNHLVRIVNETIEEMGLERLLSKGRAGGGTSPGLLSSTKKKSIATTKGGGLNVGP